MERLGWGTQQAWFEGVSGLLSLFREGARRYDVKLERVLRSRRRIGRCMPLINVIPPGLDFSSLKVRHPAFRCLPSFHISV